MVMLHGRCGMIDMNNDLSFYKGKKVVVTGHTGFKGSWMCRMLLNAGANVTGYGLEAPTNPALYHNAGLEDVDSIVADIRDYEYLRKIFKEKRPEIVFHMAAQPLVRKGYTNPRYTYETNVMGTVNLLECVREIDSVRSVLNITTDKVYKNNEWCWGYRENEPLDGFDPYSNSKSCSELVTRSYKSSFFADGHVAISTARAGNVIGGGDFATDRIIPDCVKAVLARDVIKVRNPYSIRPYQHVLEPLFVYAKIAQRQYEDVSYADCYNVGPNESDCINTGELVEIFCKLWGNGAKWIDVSDKNSFHEAEILKLDCSKLKKKFGWKPRWHIEEAVKRVCEFTKVWNERGDIPMEMDRQIREFLYWHCEG